MMLVNVISVVASAGTGAVAGRMWTAKKVDEARKDPMTGLYTRTKFEEGAKKLLGRTDVTMVMIDLDGLKQVNDHDGHSAGDEFIRDASRKIRQWLPRTALVARLGGDEFAAVWEGPFDAEDLHSLARSIRASIGVVRAPKGVSYSDALGEADTAMYFMKRRGGGWGLLSPQTVTENAPRRWARNKDQGRKINGIWTAS